MSDEQGPVSLVYFVLAGDFLKVGITTDVNRRMHTLRTSSPFEIELLGVVSGDAVYERLVHDKFSPWHHRREWFRADRELLSIVRKLARPPDEVIAEEMRERVRAVLDGADSK